MNARSGSPPSALAVYLHGRRTGVITRLAGDRHIFAFEEDHVDDPGRPTLSLAFKSATGGLVTEIRDYRVRVPPFFSNLLPEGHLRERISRRFGTAAGRVPGHHRLVRPDCPTCTNVEESAELLKFSTKTSDDHGHRQFQRSG